MNTDLTSLCRRELKHVRPPNALTRGQKLLWLLSCALIAFKYSGQPDIKNLSSKIPNWFFYSQSSQYQSK